MKKIILLYGSLVVILIFLALLRADKLNFGGISGSLPGERNDTAQTAETSDATNAQASIKGNTYNLLVAKSDAERMQGLSGREKLDDDQGMLFIFEQKALYPFWMKNMNFPIDIIYIDNNRVVEIKENATPPAKGQHPSTTMYNPKAQANYVLEVNSGEVKDKKIKVGDTVEFSNLQ